MRTQQRIKSVEEKKDSPLFRIVQQGTDGEFVVWVPVFLKRKPRRERGGEKKRKNKRARRVLCELRSFSKSSLILSKWLHLVLLVFHIFVSVVLFCLLCCLRVSLPLPLLACPSPSDMNSLGDSVSVFCSQKALSSSDS